MEGKREEGGVCINMRTILVTISCTRDRVPRFLSIHDNLLRGGGRERQTGSEAIKIMHNFRCLRNINRLFPLPGPTGNFYQSVYFNKGTY